MPGVDWVPGLSQLKAGFQLITGDVEGAARTTENFGKECPGISQVVSLVQLANGDEEGALETQRRCLGTINNVANGIPVVGHVKGVVHHIVGDHEGGNQALNAASRTTVVIASGAAAGLATGGLGAIPAGIAAGGAYDITASVITEKPQGYVAAVANAMENPSAGAIFDAAVIPVADGLAGYSGGQIANKVSSHIKVGKLEAARAAKTDQLHAGMFEDAGMNSGQLHSLGQEINALTSEINVIRQGTPQYWFNPKTGEVTVDLPSNNVSVPVVGYIEEDNDGKKKEILREIYTEQENALLADLYVREVATARSRASKEQLLEERKAQNPENKKLSDVYRRVPVVTKEKLNEMKEQFQRNDPNNKLKRIFSGYSWLHVRMPSQFNYTGAIMVNNAFQGLLHTFVRHSDQWADYIPNFNEEIRRVSALKELLDRIVSAETPDSANSALCQFIEALKQLNDETFIAVQTALSDIQMDLHQFIQQNVTYENYLGEGVNVHGKQQVYFKVKDKNGNFRVMVVCVSDQLFPSDSSFYDSRPIRTITTVFFISRDDYLQRMVKKTF